MIQERQPREHVSHVVKLYHRGIICPSEMWNSLADVLTPATATDVLDSLSQETKEQLLAVYVERPPAVYIERSPSRPGEEKSQPVYVQVVRWCEANGPPLEIPTEPDGLIRVRVEGGSVKEWRPWEHKSPADR